MKFDTAILFFVVPGVLGAACDAAKHNPSKCMANGHVDAECCAKPSGATCALGYTWSPGEEGCGGGFRNDTRGSCCTPSTPSGLYCRAPFVDFPTCKTPYSATNWWYDVYSGIMEAWYLILVWDGYRSALKLTRHGLPRTVEAVQYMLLVIYGTLEILSVMNIHSLRHGGWLGVISSCSHALLWFPSAGIMISALASVRSAARLQGGKLGLPKWEYRVYLVGSAFTLAVSIPTLVVRVLSEMDKVSSDLLRRCEVIRYGGVIGVCIIHLVLALLFIRTFRDDPRSKELLKTSKVWSSGSLILISFIGYQVYYQLNNKWEGLVGEMRASVDALDAEFIPRQIARVALSVLGSWCIPRWRNHLGLQWERAHDNEEMRWVEIGEAVMASAVVLFFAIGLYLPIVMPPPSVDAYLRVLIFALSFIATLWIERSGRPAREYLCDLCVSTFLRKGDTVVDMLKFHGLTLKDTAFDFILFSTMPFSLATPWPSEMRSFDWMGNLEFLALNSGKQYAVYTTLLVVYIGWLFASFVLRAFPTSSWVNQAHLAISWLLYLPCGLTTTRLLLGSVICREDGTLTWNGMQCDMSSMHLFFLVVGISGAAWFVCLPSLHFAGIGKFRLRALVIQNPTVSVRNHFLRTCAMFSAIYLAGTWRILADFVIVLCVTAQQIYDPLIVGRAQLNSIHTGALLAALTCHVLAPLNFIRPQSFIPMITCLICVPFMFVVGYKRTQKRFSIMSVKIKTQVDNARNADFAKQDLPPRLLAACLHAPPLNQFLCTHLGIPTERVKSRSTVAPESQPVVDDALTSLALAHLTAATSVGCGRVALLQFPDFVTVMPKWLNSPHRSAAIKCVHEMARVEALHTVLRARVLSALLASWRLVDGVCHTRCAEIVGKIRGADKIIVSFGPIQQIRAIVIPRKTVWIVPYAHVLNKNDPIDALLTFPPKWGLPLHHDLPINVPHLCIPVGRCRAPNIVAHPMTPFSRLLSAFEAMRRAIRSIGISLIPTRSSVNCRAPGSRRAESSVNLPTRANAATLPTSLQRETTALSTLRQSTSSVMSVAPQSKVCALPTELDDEVVGSLASLGGGDGTTSALRQGGEGDPHVPAGSGEEVPPVAQDKRDGTPSAVRQGGVGEPCVSGGRVGEVAPDPLKKQDGTSSTVRQGRVGEPRVPAASGEEVAPVAQDKREEASSAVRQGGVGEPCVSGGRGEEVAPDPLKKQDGTSSTARQGGVGECVSAGRGEEVAPVAQDTRDGASSTARQGGVGEPCVSVGRGEEVAPVAQDTRDGASSTARQGGVGEPCVPGGRGEEVAPIDGGKENSTPSLAWQAGEGKLRVAKARGVDAPSVAGESEETPSVTWREGDETLSVSVKSGSASVTQKGAKSKPAAAVGGKTRTPSVALPSSATCEDRTGASPAPQPAKMVAALNDQQGGGKTWLLGALWPFPVRGIATWVSSRIWRKDVVAQGKTRGVHVLFRLGEDCNWESEEDGVPTQRLREELTAFYAFNEVHVSNDEVDGDTADEERAKVKGDAQENM